MTSIAFRGRQILKSLERAFRLGVLARLPVRKEFLVLNSAAYAPGLFSEFAAVLGMLEHYESWPGRYAGVKVDFKDQGLYFDPSAGQNWWEYYFEPVEVGSATNARPSAVSEGRQAHFASRAEQRMSRRAAFELIGRYIRVRSRIREKVDSHVRQHFSGAYVIGVHYRGTDKRQEAPQVPYEAVQAAVRDAIQSAGTERFRLFLATDEQSFVDYMVRRYPDRLVYRQIFRSSDGNPIHERRGNNYQKGEDAVIDCLLLSRCDYLIRTASNLSLCATFLSPALPVALLNRET